MPTVTLSAGNGVRGQVIDLDTGAPIPKPITLTYDPVTGSGTIKAYQCNHNGSIKTNAGGDFLTYTAGGRFKFISAGEPIPPKCAPEGAPRCKCGSRLTLPGDDLCAACRAKERGQRHKMCAEKVERNYLITRKCELCSRAAEWGVSDEVEASPERGPALLGLPLAVQPKTMLFKRVACVKRRWYCSTHFKPPRLLDPRGEVIKDIEEGLRPQ